MSLENETGDYVLLHNPRCSKSRATKELLESHGVAFHERHYLEEPLDEREVRAVVRRLGLAPSSWIRSGEAEFAARGLSLDASEDELIGAIAAEPKLLQRPILVRGAAAAIGRPPENVLPLLDSPRS